MLEGALFLLEGALFLLEGGLVLLEGGLVNGGSGEGRVHFEPELAEELLFF